MKRGVLTLVVTILVISNAALSANVSKSDAIEPHFTLVALSRGGLIADYFNLLKQQIARIGINLDVKIVDWPTFVGEIFIHHNYDIVYLALSGGSKDPDFTGVYNENGSLNLFGYHTSMDYNETLGTGVNEWFMKEGTKIMPPNSQERIEHYWAWQQHLMDNILPCLPTFAPKVYDANWANLNGYNMTEGILKSWGKMSWDGTHTGQLNTNEVVISDAIFSDLNPIFQDDSASSFISSATMNSLVYYDDDLTVWPHLATNWTHLSDTQVRVTLREGVKWQEDPDGNFTNEYFDAEDVYFTFKTMRSIQGPCEKVLWLDHMEIIDNYTIDFFIDNDPYTLEKEPFAGYLTVLETMILPEHYLNQTQIADGVTPDICHPSWKRFAEHCFGTGLFNISDYDKDTEITMTLNPESWMLNSSLTSDSNLNWEQRFGDFSESPTQLRIKFIQEVQISILEFLAGGIDIHGVTWDKSLREQLTQDENFEVQSDTQFYFSFFGFNMRSNRPNIGNPNPAPFNDSISVGLAIRKAICYATDLEEINNFLHAGEYTITYHPVHTKLGVWRNPNIIKYTYNLALAKKYFSYAGYELDSNYSYVANYNWFYSLSAFIGFCTILFHIRKRREER